MLCSFAHLAWSLLLQALLHEEELCKVFFVGRVVPLSGLCGSLFFEFLCLWSIRPMLQYIQNSSPILEGLQH